MYEVKCKYIKQYIEKDGSSFDELMNQMNEFKSNIPALISTFQMSYGQFKELGLYSIAKAYKDCEESLYMFYNNLPITDDNISTCNTGLLECINCFEKLKSVFLSPNISYEYKVAMNEVINFADIFILSMKNFQKITEAVIKFKKECLQQPNNDYNVSTTEKNEYINNFENKSIKNYIQNIHDIVCKKHFIAKQSMYNVFFAFYTKKKLEVAEENYELGLQEFYTENLDKAKEYFEYALSLAPYNKEYKACLKQIKKEENKTIAEENIMLGIAELNNGNANKAIQYFDDALNIYECAKAFFLRGKAFLTQGNITLCEKAIYNFNKAISLESNNSEYYFYCGKAHFERYHYNEALECFNKAINLKNDNWEYHYQRGLTNYEIGNYADSIEDYSKAISLNCEILQNEDILYDIQDSVDKVESISSNSEKVKHIKALMTKGNEYVDIGCDYLNKNNFNTAIEYFNKAIEINFNYKYGYFNRANAYLRLKEYQNAINDYNKVIELDPTCYEALFNRGLIYYDLRLYNKAINDYNIVLKLNALDAHAYYLRGIAYFMDNMQSMAIKDFASACIIDDSYINRISEDTNTNLMPVMNILEKLPCLSEEETINVIQQIQEMPDEDLGLQEQSQNSELSSENLSVIKNSIRKIDL